MSRYNIFFLRDKPDLIIADESPEKNVFFSKWFVVLALQNVFFIIRLYENMFIKYVKYQKNLQ